MKEKIVTKKNIIKMILIVLLVILLGVIFSFSNQDGEKSTSVSRGITERIIEHIEEIQKLDGYQKENALLRIEAVIRKIAHFSLYTLVGIIVMGLMQVCNLKEKNKILCTLGIGVMYAISDEVHQIFIPERTAKVTDVLIDSAGVLVGICIVLLIIRIIKSIVKDKEKA